MGSMGGYSSKTDSTYNIFTLNSDLNTPKGIVVFFHGLGDSGRGVEDWIRDVHPTFVSPEIKYIFPTAKCQKSSVNAGMEMNSWFDIYSLRRNCKNNEGEVVEVANNMQELIAEELLKYPSLTEKDVIICGMSQGGVTAQATALLGEKSYGGLVVLSSWVSEAVEKIVGTMSSFKFHVDNGLKVHIAHGLSDELVYPLHGKKVSVLLSALDPVFEEFDGLGHEMNQEELMNVQKFIDAILN